MKDTIYKGEDKWFMEQERNAIEEMRKQREQHMEEYKNEHNKSEREKLRLAHWLKCPKCGNDMEVIKLDDVEVERCTVCAGLFFDAGEFDSLVLRKQEGRFKFYRRMFGLE